MTGGANDAGHSFVPIAATTRSGHDESLHHGAVAVIAADGSLAWSAGDPEVDVYVRSAIKPLQGAAMLAAGLDVEDRLLAVVCASHDGRPEHVAAVEQILAGAGLDVRDLENTPSMALDPSEADEAVRAGRGPSAVADNCSGKHAGMLATAVANGWPTAGYIDADHPVQRVILGELDLRVGPVRHVGIDGCGAPAPVVALGGLARGVRRLAVDGHPVYRAMTMFPEMVAGPTRAATRLMRLVPGLVAKDGAEGVFVVALPDGRAVAVKVADGARRAAGPVVVAALRSTGVDLAADALGAPILGHGEPVGSVRSLVGVG
ncbi:MAG: asparaginase [Ilumatobacteraceae bacterium]